MLTSPWLYLGIFFQIYGQNAPLVYPAVYNSLLFLVFHLCAVVLSAVSAIKLFLFVRTACSQNKLGRLPFAIIS